MSSNPSGAKPTTGKRKLKGAEIIFDPSQHWGADGENNELLLRARAIENGAYVFAPAQCGTHPHGRKTYGHSLIVDPWGEVLADGGEQPGVIMAEITRPNLGSMLDCLLFDLD